MTKRPSVPFAVFVFFAVFFQVFSLMAAPVIQPEFEGVLVVTSPAGDLTLLEPGEKIPAIVSDSVIEVFDGSFTVTTGQGDKVTGSCLNHKVKIENGASVKISGTENSGLVTVLEGEATVIDPSGKIRLLKKGEEYPISLTVVTESPAPTTAAGEPLGGPPAGGDLGQVAPPDSRNLQSSPQ